MAFYDFAVQIGHYQMFGLHGFIRDAAGLDNYQRIFAGNAAGVAKGVENQSVTNQLEIGFKNFFAEFGEKHQWSAEAIELRFEM
jgi:hypothetical protein